MQRVPDVGAAAGRTQPRQPQLRPVGVGDRLEFVQLRDVLARDDDRQLEAFMPAAARWPIAASAVA